jgi:hypothetical protein
MAAAHCAPLPSPIAVEHPPSPNLPASSLPTHLAGLSASSLCVLLPVERGDRGREDEVEEVGPTIFYFLFD